MAVVEEAIPAPASERLRLWAVAAARPLLEGIAALVVTAVLVIWLADLTLSNVSLQGLTLNLLLVGSEPFRGMTTLEALATGVQRTGALLVAAMAAASLVGVGAGVVFAVSSSRLGRALAWAVGTLGIALPSFFWAMLLQLAVVEIFLATGKRPFPTSGFGLDAHLALPTIALAARPTAYLFRVTATALEEVRHAEYVRAARARGLVERLVLERHMLPNALPAILSGFGIAARGAISSLAIVEYVFTWNGAGFGFIHALANRNVPLATAIAVAFAVALALVGVAVALVSRLADPGLRRECPDEANIDPRGTRGKGIRVGAGDPGLRRESPDEAKIGRGTHADLPREQAALGVGASVRETRAERWRPGAPR